MADSSEERDTTGHEGTPEARSSTKERPTIRFEQELQRLVDAADPSWEPIQFYRDLERRHFIVKGKPSLRTVRRRVDELRRQRLAADSSGPWSMDASDPDDAALILACLAVATEQSGGRVVISESLAQRIVQIARVAPTLPLAFVRLVALAFQRAPAGSTRDLELFLAFRPWEDKQRCERYNALLQGGAAEVPQGLGFPPWPEAKPDVDMDYDWPDLIGTRQEEAMLAIEDLERLTPWERDHLERTHFGRDDKAEYYRTGQWPGGSVRTPEDIARELGAEAVAWASIPRADLQSRMDAAIAAVQAISDACKAEERDLTQEERRRVKKLVDEAKACKAHLETGGPGDASDGTR
ncbi:MAG: hypothetical protein ACYC5O_03845 [Anaerolineae bacterium]